MVRSIGLTTSFQKLGEKEHERIGRKKFELFERVIEQGCTPMKPGNGVVMSQDWDPNRPTVLFCHGRAGSAGSSGYMNIPQEIAKYKFDGNCNIAIVLHQAPGNQDTMVQDALDAVEHITHQRGDKNVRLQDVHLAGYSIGCITASALAYCHPEAARLTLLLPPTNMPDAAEYTFAHRKLKGISLSPLKQTANWLLRQVDGNHRSTVDYISKMHDRAIAIGIKDVMPVEALLSLDDKVAEPKVFMEGLRQCGLYVEPGHADNAVAIAIEKMHNSPDAHTEAFSLDKNFPQLKDRPDILNAPLERTAPVRQASQQQGMAR